MASPPPTPGEAAPPSDGAFPTDKATALRLGRRLVAEVTIRDVTRRAWISIMPDSDDHDEAARREGWERHDQDRSFRVVHREYLIEELDGFDYDRGMSELRAARVESLSALERVLGEWGVAAGDFAYPWNSDYPE